MRRISKDRYYLEIAKTVALRSTCSRRKYGAIIVVNDTIVSTGYNGPVRKGINCDEINACLKEEVNAPHYRGYEFCIAVHAEQNAIINAARNGVSIVNGKMYMVGLENGKVVRGLPCLWCRRFIINAGIKEVITLNENGEIIRYNPEDWIKDEEKWYFSMIEKVRKKKFIYKPNDDTFLLLEVARNLTKGKKVLEVGCGSGYVMENLREIAKEIEGVDINEEAVRICREKGLNVYKSDLFKNVKGKFDVILFNPPYLPESIFDDYLSYNEKVALVGGEDGIEVVDRFLEKLKDFLNEGGFALIILSSLQNLNKLFNKYKNDYKFEKLKEKRLFFETLYCYKVTPKS